MWPKFRRNFAETGSGSERGTRSYQDSWLINYQEQPTIGNKNAVTLYETIIIEAEWSSYKERRVDALALRAEERRDKLR